MSAPAPPIADSKPNKPASQAPGLRVLVAAQVELAAHLRATFEIIASWVSDGLTIDVESERSEIAATLGRDRHDIYVIENEVTGQPLLDLLPAELADGTRRVVLVITEGPAPEPIEPLAAHRILELIEREHVSAPLMWRCIQYAQQRMNDHRALRMAEERYALALAAANDGMWHWDRTRETIHFSRRWKAILGFDESDIGRKAKDWFDRVHPDDIDGLRADLQDHLDGLKPIHSFEHRIRAADGEWRWVLSRGLAHRASDKRGTQIAGSLTDITRRKDIESRLHTDAVTGLASRMTLMEQLGDAIVRCERDPNHRFALLFLNLDRFKVVNDSIGLESGDEILRQFGERLRETVPEDCVVYRYGGDEFAVLLDEVDEFAVADQLADVIQNELRKPFVIDGQEVFTTASIGITRSDRGYDRAAEVLRDVGVAIREAKRNSRGRKVTFDAAMRLEAVSLMRLQTALRQAVDRNEFVIYFQPIVALDTGALTGFEALVRWLHPQRGIIGPDEFVAVAEETGLIVPIGRYVLEQACRQLATWRADLPDAARDLTISVNLSSRQLSAPGLVGDLDRVLASTKLPPNCLKLELTESSIIDDTDAAGEMLHAFRERGVRLYMDDFGTGYSSLAYLHQLAIDGLKIDRSFVEMVGKPDRRAAIVNSIVSLAHNLGMGVVAEGVETPEQVAALRAIRCTEGQGYLFSRPVPHGAALDLIQRKHLA